MLNKMKVLFLSILATSILLVSCDDTEEDDDTTTTLPAAPTELMATSIDSTTIHIKWTASANEADSNWVGYHLEVKDADGTEVDHMDISTDDHTSGDPYPITGLVAGEVYTIELKAENSDGMSNEAATIMWSPAIRFSTGADGVSDIALHERASSLGSGLDLYFFDTDFGDKGAFSLSVTERADWNLALDTDNNQLIIGSASLLYTTGGHDEPVEMTEITSAFAAESLNDVFDSEGLDSKNFSEQTIDLDNQSSSFVIYVKVTNADSEEYYAKVLLKREMGEEWLRGTSPNRYVAAEISFQERTGVPYAQVIETSGNTK